VCEWKGERKGKEEKGRGLRCSSKQKFTTTPLVILIAEVFIDGRLLQVMGEKISVSDQFRLSG